MNHDDINRIFTEKVSAMLADGFQIHTGTMDGTQGELAKVDLYKGTEIYRVLLNRFKGTNTHDGVQLVVGKNTDHIRQNTCYSIHNTIWNEHLEIIFEIKFYQLGEDYYTDKEAVSLAALNKYYARYKARIKDYCRNLPDSFKSAALKYVCRQPQMKSCKLEDITRVTRVNRTNFNEVTPELLCYEIEAKGKTFRLPSYRRG